MTGLTHAAAFVASFAILAGAATGGAIDASADGPKSGPAAASAFRHEIPAHAPRARWIANLRRIAAQQAEGKDIPLPIVMAVIEIESGFDPAARGADGEIGLMQVLPGTARMLGHIGAIDRLQAPETNIRLGVAYLSAARRLAGGDLCTTLMKYRAGHGETRFSARSVEYCRRAKDILARDGTPDESPLPVATFGLSSGAAGGICVARSFVPGPGYGRCLRRASKAQAATIARQRLALFGR